MIICVSMPACGQNTASPSTYCNETHHATELDHGPPSLGSGHRRLGPSDRRSDVPSRACQPPLSAAARERDDPGLRPTRADHHHDSDRRARLVRHTTATRRVCASRRQHEHLPEVSRHAPNRWRASTESHRHQLRHRHPMTSGRCAEPEARPSPKRPFPQPCVMLHRSVQRSHIHQEIVRVSARRGRFAGSCCRYPNGHTR